LTCRWQRHSVKPSCWECSTTVEQAETQLRVVVPIEEEEESIKMYFEMWWNDLINYEVISNYVFVNWFFIVVRIMNCRKHSTVRLSLFCGWFFNPVSVYYTYCGSVRPVVAWEFWCREFGKIHIIDMKLSGWLQLFCLFGGELCNCTLTDQSYWYCGFYLAFLWDSIIPVSYLLFVMTSPATLQSDTKVLLLVTSFMLGGFYGPNLLLEVVQNTVIWNVTVGLSLLYSESHQILLKTILPP
jgi:hypothetical protein